MSVSRTVKMDRPSSNWLDLQKTLTRAAGHGHPRQRRRIHHDNSLGTLHQVSNSPKTPAFPRSVSRNRHGAESTNELVDLETTEVKNGESISGLRRMVLGRMEYKDGTSQTAPGKYLALDCEMVGVGIEGSESSLARVSIVNYAGAIVLDVFVRQREKVVDYRTQWSGVRRTDLVGSAKPFKEVQQTVADLVKDRILVGHAIYNDLKALLLSHPSPQIRDTQQLAFKHGVVKSRRPALRVLVKQELGIVIQAGEHSSVTDARATMALFRLHRKQWERGFRSIRTVASNKTEDDRDGRAVVRVQSSQPSSSVQGGKRERSESTQIDDNEVDEASRSSLGPRAHSPLTLSHSPAVHISTSKRLKQSRRSCPPLSGSGRRKGISSGISTVIKRAGGAKEIRMKGNLKSSVVGKKREKTSGEKWWKSLTGGKKGSIQL